VHKGFERGELQTWVESAGFGNVRFSTDYEIRKEIDGREKTFPVFLMTAQKSGR
jgi:hypothetical protein